MRAETLTDLCEQLQQADGPGVIGFHITRDFLAGQWVATVMTAHKGEPSDLLTEQARQRGLSLEEPDGGILELRQHGKVIARFSQTGVEVDNVLKEIQQPGKN